MPLSHIVNNIGVGKVEGTFLNLTTTLAAASATPFTEARVDAYQRAASLVGNNYLAHGTTTFNLFGAVQAVSENETAKGFPERLVCQLYGCAEIQGTTGNGGAPAVNVANYGYHVMQRDGFVAVQTTSFASGADSKSRGQIIEVYDTDRCVVLLG